MQLPVSVRCVENSHFFSSSTPHHVPFVCACVCVLVHKRSWFGLGAFALASQSKPFYKCGNCIFNVLNPSFRLYCFHRLWESEADRGMHEQDPRDFVLSCVCVKVERITGRGALTDFLLLCSQLRGSGLRPHGPYKCTRVCVHAVVFTSLPSSRVMQAGRATCGLNQGCTGTTITALNGFWYVGFDYFN